MPKVLGVSVLDLLRAGQRPMLAIAARLGHFRDPGAVDRALKRAGTLIGLDELLDSVIGATPPGPPPPRLDGVRRGPAVDQGRRLAGEVRRVLGLGDGPLARFPELLEERFRLDVDLSPLP